MAGIVINRRSDADKLRQLLDKYGDKRNPRIREHPRDTWLSCVNQSNETAPPFACMAITGALLRGRSISIQITKPSSTQNKAFAFNGPEAIPSGKPGVCTFGPVIVAAIKSSTNPMVIGSVLGVTGWELDILGSQWLSATIRAGLQTGPGQSLVEIGRVESSGKKFFRTLGGGIPAATDQFNLGGAQCERMRFSASGGGVIMAESPPAFEDVWNGSEVAIPASEIIQCCRIDGAWVIDTQHCRP